MIREKEFEENDEMYCLCETKEDFEQFCEECGWGDSIGFQQHTGVQLDTIVGRWFMVIRDRVFIIEDGKSVQISGFGSERRKEDVS